MSGQVDGRFVRSAYVSLTTFRRDGRPVATPVWFAVDGDRILAWSGATEGKVKRIRNNSRVMVAICDYRGKVKGARRRGDRHPAAPGRGREGPSTAEPEVLVRQAAV